MIIGSLEFIFEGLIYLFLSIYFEFISKYWTYILYPTYIVLFLGLIPVLSWMPESPRLLVTQKKYDRARKVFNQIAVMNGKGKFACDSIIFSEEF